MSDIETKFEYFYVCYMGAGYGGSMVIPQHLEANGEPSEDGFNLAAATRHLYGQFGSVVIIQSWQRITKKRNDEFEEFVLQVQGGVAAAPGKISHLRLVQNEGAPQ